MKSNIFKKTVVLLFFFTILTASNSIFAKRVVVAIKLDAWDNPLKGNCLAAQQFLEENGIDESHKVSPDDFFIQLSNIIEINENQESLITEQLSVITKQFKKIYVTSISLGFFPNFIFMNINSTSPETNALNHLTKLVNTMLRKAVPTNETRMALIPHVTLYQNTSRFNSIIPILITNWRKSDFFTQSKSKATEVKKISLIEVLDKKSDKNQYKTICESTFAD